MKPVLGFSVLVALAMIVFAGGAPAGSAHRPLLQIAVASSGVVKTSDGRLRCRDRCSTAYRRGRVLRLTAFPDDDFLFDHWEGACIGTASNCEVALDGKTSVRAVFSGVPSTLAVMVGGPGRVTSSVGGLDCGDGGSGCRVDVPRASTVTLTPVPTSGGRFGGWVGPCASAGTGACTLRIDRPYTEVAAAFGHSSPQQGPQRLIVHSFGGVTSDPAGLDCPPGTTCSADFPSGTLVVLQIVSFGRWLPPCQGDLRRCALIVDAPTEVQSAESPSPPPPPPPPAGMLLVTVSGRGLVTSSNGAIRCGWTPAPQTRCSDTVPPVSTTRHLRAKARRPFGFARWGGLCRGAKRACTARLQRASHGQTDNTFSVTGLFRRR